MATAKPSQPIAIIGLGAVMPDAPDLPRFWENIVSGKDSIREVPSERWLTEDYYDPDPKAPDKTYAKIGAFVEGFVFDSTRHRIPPKVAAAMDNVQKWAIEACRQALADSGYEGRDFDRSRTAVVIGNAMGSELHHLTNMRVNIPKLARWLSSTASVQALLPEARLALLQEYTRLLQDTLPPVTEDTMPGELSNVIAGRVANVFDLRGPNFTTDAACASAMAALEAAVGGLSERRYDMVLTGGTDSSMSPMTFVKFSKIGALSPDRSCPFDQRANGFVMGEGCGILVLKRIEDAERDGDRVYAVVRALGSSSDGRGKGITAPNPVGQKLAMERAYALADLSPAEVSLLEAHGTSTSVGDLVEATVACEIFSAAGAKDNSIAMGSVKSQIGHLKSAAGAASLLKAALSIHHAVIPGSLHFEQPNPKIPFGKCPVFVPRQPSHWKPEAGKLRVAGVSSFGFGGTNFHAILAEYRPGSGQPNAIVVPSGDNHQPGENPTMSSTQQHRGSEHRILMAAANDPAGLKQALGTQLTQPRESDPIRLEHDRPLLQERLAIVHGSDAERRTRAMLALTTLENDLPSTWRALAGQGIFRCRGSAPKVAFLFPGQGSQYVNMLDELRRAEPLVAETFAEADRVMMPELGRPLSSFVFTEDSEANNEALRDTKLCQPAMLAADVALARLLGQHGIQPDFVAGHSLGEYAALVVGGMLPFPEALMAVSARAKEMSGVQVADPGKMAAVVAPFDQILELLRGIDGVVPANYNCRNQTVIAGGSATMDQATARLEAAGIKVVALNVSHAFHSYIVAPAVEPLHRMLRRLPFQPPRLPVIANLDAQPYDPNPQALAANLERLSRQVASPVRFVESIERLYQMGARLFIEVGPRKVLANFVLDVLNDPEVVAVATNHPKLGDFASFAQALAACAAAGLQAADKAQPTKPAEATTTPETAPLQEQPAVVITGASLGIPGVGHDLFAEDNDERLLSGQSGIDPIPEEDRRRLAGQRIVRLVKDAPGGPVFEVIDQPDQVAQLSGRKGRFDLASEFGLDPERVASFDVTTKLAIAAGLLALRDAGIPLQMQHRTTTTGKKLPTGWRLPKALADETGIVFASAFPGYDELVTEMNRRAQDELVEARIQELRNLEEAVGPLHHVRQRIEALERTRGDRFSLDRKFIFRALAMGHAQLAELIGARGPNLQINGACASTTQGVILASDWIRTGRCRRVLVVGADDITNATLSPWLVGGMLATGAVTTEAVLERAALPFDRRRNGMITGMGAVGLVIEDAACARERGLRPLVRLLGSVMTNSAYHGSRLDPEHVCATMERLIQQVEREHGLDRRQLAKQLVFISHETYTPARGGSASAEVRALRQTFGEQTDGIVIANTKGLTGHPMGVGIEDAAAVRMLAKQVVPPVPNYREPDPDLGTLNLSRGGSYDVRYALRLAAGFGSQVALTLLERVGGNDDRVCDPARRLDWFKAVSGIDHPDLEVSYKTLRLIEPTGAIAAEPAIEEPASSSENSILPLQPVVAVVPETVPPPLLPPATPEAVAPAALDLSAIQARILEIVAKKTGYPVEMLELDLDLEADLGIDTVKQAEMFSEIRAAFGIPKQENLKLSEYNTLAKVIGFAKDKTGLQAPAAKPAAPDLSAIQARILEIVAKKTGYPVEMLELDLDLEADLGIDTVKQAEMFSEIRASFGIPKQENLKLSEYNTLAKVIGFAKDKTGLQAPAAKPAAPAPQPDAPKTEPAPPPAPEAPVAVAPAAPDLSAIQARILEIVAKKTGYPVEMLELDLDLEADLGIDTVKQAEMFSEIRAAFGIPKQENLKLSEYNTLAKVIGFAKDKTGLQAPAAKPAAPALQPDAAKPEAATLPQPAARARSANLPQAAGMFAADAESTISATSEAMRFLAPVLVGRPASEHCLTTGAAVAGRSFIVGDFKGTAGALQHAIQRKGGSAELIGATGNPDAVAAEILKRAAGSPPAGVWMLTALSDPVHPGSEDQAGWHRALDERARLPFRVARSLSDFLADRPGSFFVCATRMGGQLGLDAAGAADPAAGATTGFVKALAREWSQTVCKVVDFPVEADPADIAEALLEEAERDAGVIEVGRAHGARWGAGLGTVDLPTPDQALAGRGLLPAKDPVVLVTGGAGDIVGQIVADLARACGGCYYLADLAESPNPDDTDIAALANDREGLKTTLAERLRSRGERVTPVLVEKALREAERKSAMLTSLQAVRAAGGRTEHLALDITDVAAVTATVDRIREKHGRLDLVLHAAGLEHSQALSRKAPESFDRIFGVKVEGLHALLAATVDLSPTLVLFSSVAGRFGNAGQTDYAAANDLLAKAATGLKQTHPGLNVVTLDFSAWGGRGMATRGSVPEQMARAGITLIPPGEGIPSVRRALAAGGSGELVVACSLGVLADSLRAKGVDLPALQRRQREQPERFPLLGEVLDWTLADGLRLEVSFDPAKDPYLNDHRIDGTVVLPGVMAVETFAEAALLLNPSHTVVSVEDLAFEAPLKLYRDQARRAQVRLLPTWDGRGQVLLASMETSRKLLGGKLQAVRHFHARVRLDRVTPKARTETPPGNGGAREIGQEAIYQAYFHGPSFQVLEKVTTSADGKVAGWLMSGRESPPLGKPGSLSAAPMLAELAFQAAGIVEASTRARLGLPAGFKSLKLHPQPPGDRGRVAAWVVPQRGDAGPQYGVKVMDERGFVLLELDGYRTSPFPNVLPDSVRAQLLPKGGPA